jgi:hypothetical protein
VGAILALSVLAPSLAEGLVQDARDRLTDAVQQVDLKKAETALLDLAGYDGKRAARVLIYALPRARDRMDVLLKSTVGARQAYDNIDTSFAFNLEEERIKQKALAAAKERIKEACRVAVEGEKIYDAIRAALAGLKPEGVPILAAEADRTASWILKCELYEALGALGAGDALRAALRKEKEPVVQAAILAGAAWDGAAGFLDHPKWQLRNAGLAALRSSKDAVPAILDALGAPDLRFRNAACETLVGLTGTKLPPDPAVWTDWWKANAGDFLSGQYNPAAPKELPGPRRTTFYDVPVVSSRVLFVIDRSGSMRENNRFDQAKAELKRLLGELPDGARANVIFFGGTSSSWVRTTRALDAQARRDAADFIERQGYEAGTDLYAALERGLALVGSAETGLLRDDGPDTIFVLSDGIATVGRLVDDELVARVISRRARYLRPIIHTVSLSSEARSLKLLSDLTGGEYRTK